MRRCCSAVSEDRVNRSARSKKSASDSRRKADALADRLSRVAMQAEHQNEALCTMDGREGAALGHALLIRVGHHDRACLLDATSARLQERSRQTLNVPGGLEEIDGLLRVHPEVRRSPKGRAESQRHLGRHGAPAVDDAVHDLDVALQVVGQDPLAQAERDEELLAENFPGDVGLRRRMRSLIFIPRLSGSP